MTRLVETFGGRLGGVLGTLPTTIVPAAGGIWLANPDPSALATAMAAVPAGMLVDAGFLYVWRALPPRLPGWSLALRLAVVSAASLTVWAVLALGALAVVEAVLGTGASPALLGAAFTATHVLVGVLACLAPREAPKGKKPVRFGTLVLRGGLAAVAIGVSVLIASLGNPALAGVASVFPAIFLTTMVSLWWSQGEAVPAGAVGPMMLGGAAVSGYALVATFTLPSLGVAAGSVVAWVAAATLFTAPSAWWLSRRQR
ncbi:MAG: hypothetical protein EP330_01595 [Deltaproteobacteria bacterium]|nr:MAG: hypothetical protein EP330_01595 [Deltaproteobacteria bacterium]